MKRDTEALEKAFKATCKAIAYKRFLVRYNKLMGRTT